MFDLDVELRRWRRRQERTSSLSPRELDELEDHLRARVDLLLETNAAPAPKQAFEIAQKELGKSATLANEFAKSGKPRWKKLLLVGWAMYAVSFFLPVSQVYWTPESGMPGLRPLWGWQAFFGSLLAVPVNPISLVSGLSNFLVLGTFLKLRGTRPPESNWLMLGLMVAALLNLKWAWEAGLETGVGYWIWAASFPCIAAALWMRARERAPAEFKGSAQASGQGVFE